MKVYHGIEQFEKIQKAVVTTGTFDGVHVGHMTIIQRLIEVARKKGGESVVLTFYPHPRMVLQPDSELKLINTIEEKTVLLEKAGIEHLIIHPFTLDFSRTSSLEFVRDLLVNKIGTEVLVIGYDHHFGRNREGSFEHLKEFGPLYGFEVEEIPAQEVDEVNVSSTKIRRAIKEGDIQTANQYLGHHFQLNGTVVKGKQLGRTLGFPTANIDLNNPFKLLPPFGVYAVIVHRKGKVYKGMMNIGIRPSIQEDNPAMSIEVHLFELDEMFYGEKLSVEIIERIRPEKKFDSLEELKQEMEKDKVKTQHILR